MGLLDSFNLGHAGPARSTPYPSRRARDSRAVAALDVQGQCS